MQFGQAVWAKPNEDHVPENVLLALGNTLAAPAEFQGLNSPPNVLLHLD
jgi:hypothetical protein